MKFLDVPNNDDDGFITLSVRLSREEMDQVEAAAKRDGFKKSAWARYALRVMVETNRSIRLAVTSKKEETSP